MKRPSIYTIAREAGVSTATVSKIVNNHGNISRETSARVLEIIKKHNYVPQQRKQTESAVGVITFHNNRRPLASPFTGRLLNGVCLQCFEEGKDMILIDDMISSGDTIIKIASLLKEKGAGKVYICSTFGFFTDGLEKFDEAHKKGYFDKLLTTNLVYQSPELLEKPYYISCDMSKYIALIIDTLNHDTSVSHLLNPVDRIKRCVNNYMSQYEK